MLLMSGLGSDRTVEQFTCTKHGVHDHGELGDYQKFRVWAGIMGKKDPQYVTTQRTIDTQ